MLLRFRTHKIAPVADIEKAFLQIGLQESQRDVTRFVWLKNIDNPRTDTTNLQEYRFCRVPFGVISSPFLLGATIEHHLDSYKSEIAEKTKKNIYVDDVITGTNSIPEATTLYKEAKRMFNEASLNLREWISNSSEVNESFLEEDRVKSESIKVLGHDWDVRNDTLTFKSCSQSDNAEITKRHVLKSLATGFDPLGLVCLVVFRGKLFLQDLWRKEQNWDDLLSDQDQEKWKILLRDLVGISKCCVPRYVGVNETGVEHRLTCFCDASQKAYA